MPATIETVRKIALALPGVEEGVCFGAPTFYLRRKLMLRLREDGETLVVKFPKEERDDAIAREPDIFSLTSHYENHPVVLVSLTAVSVTRQDGLIKGAWRLLASQAQIAALAASRGRQAEVG